MGKAQQSHPAGFRSVRPTLRLGSCRACTRFAGAGSIGLAAVRYRDARFFPDGKCLLALSDESGELEFERLPANGVGEVEGLTHDGMVFRFDGVPSPDGNWIAYQDKDQQLWLFDIAKKRSQRIAVSSVGGFADLRWSPDSQWLAFAAAAENLYRQIRLYQVSAAVTTALTSDRVNSYSPAWSPDGKWIYFLSERRLKSLIESPWGPRQPEPFFETLREAGDIAVCCA